MKLHDFVVDHSDRIISLAHAIHENPELSLKEYDTSELIRRTLTSANIEILDAGLDTGVIGIIRGGQAGPTVALRADIDALPIEEDSAHAVRSHNPGVMHACGHDVHTAALLGAALALADMRAQLPGNVLLLFQPAEELSQGAKAIIATGVFDTFRPKALFAFHVMPNLPAGTVGVRPGPLMASQEFFTVRVTGKGAHGASPQEGRDPIMAGTEIISGLQSISSRLVDPRQPFVLSVCNVHSGTAWNIIPDTMEIGGTSRFADNDLRQKLIDWVTRIAQNTALAHGCTATVEFFNSIPSVINAPALLDIARHSAEGVFGSDGVICHEMWMGSEDFSLYGPKVPAFMYHVGCGAGDDSAPLHNCRLLVGDDVLVKAAELMASSALTALEEK